MVLPDVNILIYAHRAESPDHERYSAWLTGVAMGPSPFGLSELVLQGFVRIVTNPKIFDPPSTVAQAFAFIDALTSCAGCVVMRPGATHFSIFRRLCEQHGLKSKLVADAAHAAVAIEYGCEWVSADTDFARFAPLLRFRHL